MTETIRYGLIGKQDIKLEPRTGKFEATLADGRVVLLDALDIAYLVSDAYARAALPSSPAAGQLARVTDSIRGLWLHSGAQWVAVNREVANLRDFGAKGDGTTDDTAALRAAVAAVKAAGGGTVFVPNGTYLVNPTTNGVIGTAWNFASAGGDWYAAAVIDFDDCTILGESPEATFTFPATSGARCNSVVAVLGTSTTPIRRVRLANLGVNLQNRRSANVLYAQWAEDVSVRGLHIRNHASMLDTVVFDHVTGGLIAANHWREGGIACGLYESTTVVIAQNTCYNIRELLDADKPVTSGTGTAGHGIVVIGNSYDRSTADTDGDGAIEIDGFTDVAIVGNTIRQSNNGVDLRAKVRNLTPYPGQRITIVGNTIEAVNGIGIIMGDIADNTFNNFLDVLIEGNTVHGAGGVGIRLRGTNVMCRGNLVKGCGGIGIEAPLINAANNLAEFVIEGNVVTGCTGDGINLATPGAGAINGNHVYSNTDVNGGIYVANPSGAIVISGNRTRGHTNAGIRSFGASELILAVGNLCSEANGLRWAGGSPAFALANAAVLYPGALSSVNQASRLIGWDTAAPAVGTWRQGDIVFFTNAVAAGNIGAVCVTGGTPGTWKTFGVIAA